jgi:hypothetical protein
LLSAIGAPRCGKTRSCNVCGMAEGARTIGEQN